MVIVHRKVPCITIILGIKFLPGMNTISDAEMAKIEKHRGFTSEIECGNMVIGGHHDTPTSDAADSVADFKTRAARLVDEVAGMKVSDAKKLIADMGDGYLLRALKEKDGRKGIQDAVDTRMTEINEQKGSDLRPESRTAPAGDGSTFDGEIVGTKEDVSGTKGRSAIPALNPNK